MLKSHTHARVAAQSERGGGGEERGLVCHTGTEGESAQVCVGSLMPCVAMHLHKPVFSVGAGVTLAPGTAKEGRMCVATFVCLLFSFTQEQKKLTVFQESRLIYFLCTRDKRTKNSSTVM